MLISWMCRHLFLGDRGLAILAQAESATAHTYHALALQFSGRAAESLEIMSRKEYGHAKELRKLLGWDSQDPIMTKPHPSQRASWSQSNRWALGLSSFWSWKILFGPSVFEMPQKKTLQVISMIEGLHVVCYQALAIASEEDRRRVFLSIASDELSHQISLASTHPFDLVVIRSRLLLPIAALVFLLFDWPKIKTHSSLEHDPTRRATGTHSA